MDGIALVTGLANRTPKTPGGNYWDEPSLRSERHRKQKYKLRSADETRQALLQ